MLKVFAVSGFKSLTKVEVEIPQLAVLFGPNAAGKSNLLDAVLALSRIGTSRTLSEALSEPIRGYPIEAFSFPAGGLSALLSQDRAGFRLDAALEIGKDRYAYCVEVGIQPGTGVLGVQDEYLAALNSKWEAKGSASIEKVDQQIRIRRKSKPAKPRQEDVGLNYTTLSDLRLGGVEYRAIERCRKELLGWRVYYLDPRTAMRLPRTPKDVQDIGVCGEDIAPFLFRLRGEKPKIFDAVRRVLRTLIPSVEDFTVDLDKRRGTLDIVIKQDGTEYSSRIVSEGTLRVLALCALAVNPWSGSLLAFEEPENGVHPRRLELIADLLVSLALEQGKQLIVTTHSPLFCDAILKHTQANNESGRIGVLSVRQGAEGTEVKPFSPNLTLWKDLEIAEALSTPNEDGIFQRLLLRGLLDE